jgi:hypothetical protein
MQICFCRLLLTFNRIATFRESSAVQHGRDRSGLEADGDCGMPAESDAGWNSSMQVRKVSQAEHYLNHYAKKKAPCYSSEVVMLRA